MDGWRTDPWQGEGDGCGWWRGGSRLLVRLFGLPRVCWRCGRPTTALAGLLPVDEADPEQMVVCEDERVLAVAASLLVEPARVAAGVGVVKPRLSRTAGCRYLSNGCVWCDALLGSFFLFTEDLPRLVVESGFAGLVQVAVVELSGEQMDVVLAYGTTWTGVAVAGGEQDDWLEP
jgi:hypothetical protein